MNRRDLVYVVREVVMGRGKWCQEEGKKTFDDKGVGRGRGTGGVYMRSLNSWWRAGGGTLGGAVLYVCCCEL